MTEDIRNTVVWKLRRNNLTNTWLINRLEERGTNVSKFNMSDILRGVRRNNDSDHILTQSLRILDSYEDWQEQDIRQSGGTTG